MTSTDCASDVIIEKTRRRVDAPMEQHVATSGMIEILAQNEAFHQRSDAVELGLVSQRRHVDARRRYFFRPQEIEDYGKEFGVAIDENRPAVVFQTRDATRQ